MSIKGFRLLPLGDLGPDQMEIHPMALLGAGVDGNPLAARHGQTDPDGFTHAVAGVDLRSQLGSAWKATLEGFAESVRYLDTPSRSWNGGNADGSLVLVEPDWTLALRLGWARDSEPAAPLPDEVRRQRWTGSLEGAREWRRLRIAAGAEVGRLDYLEPSQAFGEGERDQRTLAAWISPLLLGGNFSQLGVVLRYRRVLRPDSSPANSYTESSAAGLWRHALGDRTWLETRAGMMRRNCSDDTPGVASNDDRQLVEPLALLRIQHWFTPSLSDCSLQLQHGLVDGILPSVNAARQTALVGILRYAFADRWGVFTTLWLAHRTDFGAAFSNGRERSDTMAGRLGIEYRLRDGIGGRVWVSDEESRPALGDGYSRRQVVLELGVAF